MATQGMVSVVWCGRVVAKVVSGSDGWKAKEVAQAIVINIHGVPKVQDLDDIADINGFGVTYHNRITVVKKTNIPTDNELYGIDWIINDGDDVLVDRIRKTFRLRRFNPRWDKGSADHIWVANMDTGKAYRICGVPLETA